ncbi:unnamed protein product [Linum tenue]|uniref:Uncharacterized protein n=1 Tax=Linum tenue TaxID=586396 RepID=A0AAV0PGT7_9ROSI|nr:unnamed protein product [Linum tenue]
MSRRDRDRDRDRDRGRERYERDFNTRRYRSGFDREPSPKRSRRDEKLETQKVFSEPNPESGDLTHHSESGHVKTQDAVVPLVSAPGPDSKLESADDKKELEKKPNEQHHADVTPSTNSKEVPRSRTYFQVHLNVSSLGLLEFYWNWMTDVMLGKLAEALFVDPPLVYEQERRDPKDDRNERDTNRSTTNDRDRKSGGAKDDDNTSLHHDRLFKMEDEARPAHMRRQRPAFREKKTPAGSEYLAAVPMHSSQIDRRPVSGLERRDRHVVDRSERAVAGGHRRGLPPSRDRPGGVRMNNYNKGREQFNARQSSHPNQGSGTRVEKWKHDLFDEAASKSPASKNEDEHIARVEELLAS